MTFILETVSNEFKQQRHGVSRLGSLLLFKVQCTRQQLGVPQPEDCLLPTCYHEQQSRHVQRWNLLDIIILEGSKDVIFFNSGPRSESQKRNGRDFKDLLVRRQKLITHNGQSA